MTLTEHTVSYVGRISSTYSLAQECLLLQNRVRNLQRDCMGKTEGGNGGFKTLSPVTFQVKTTRNLGRLGSDDTPTAEAFHAYDNHLFGSSTTQKRGKREAIIVYPSRSGICYPMMTDVL